MCVKSILVALDLTGEFTALARPLSLIVRGTFLPISPPRRCLPLASRSRCIRNEVAIRLRKNGFPGRTVALNGPDLI